MSKNINLTKREKYNLSFLYPKYIENEGEAIDVIKRIGDIGSRTGFIGSQGGDKRREHKYDTWIAKVVKDHLKRLKNQKKTLDLSILDKELEFQAILDWMIAEKIDAFQYNFEQALQAQELWHQRIAMSMDISKIDNPDIDQSRIIYRCKDKNHFFYILNPEDLTYEGTHMGHCVGGMGYKQKIKNDSAIILSLRDKDNNPHVTTEILLRKDGQTELKGIVSQCQGKYSQGSRKPNPKYLELLQEFILYASDYYDDEVLRFMNKQYF